ncbi:aldo/keto reductase [Neobacillus niacini]|uniref:aldo/keto reductase n=1 Tax=Neobacillus niacini TaxID=86668 RepID=UPI0028559712|nr:diketogulonate reductase-like aldo/keto reductase [Neobacillus niacini]
MNTKKGEVSSLDQSLKRLGLDYVDIFYSHRPDPDTPLEETMAAKLIPLSVREKHYTLEFLITVLNKQLK